MNINFANGAMIYRQIQQKDINVIQEIMIILW
jgi:hypothetical protein